MTHQEIINKAKTLLGAVVDGIEDPVWTPEAFATWCQEGSDAIVFNVKNDLLKFLYTVSSTIVGPGEQILDNDFLKLVKVTRANKKCTVKDIATTNSLFTPSVEFPTVCRKGNKLIIEPTEPAAVEVLYIRKPVFVLDENSELPLDWQNSVVDYICMKALETDKQYEQAKYYFGLFNSKIEKINEG